MQGLKFILVLVLLLYPNFKCSGEIVEGNWKKNKKVGHCRHSLHNSGAFWCYFYQDNLEEGTDKGFFIVCLL